MISIVFFGTPDIGLKSLEHFYNSDKFDVLAVVTQPDKPSGRGHKLTPSPIKQFAVEYGIKVFQPKSIRKEPEVYRGANPIQRAIMNGDKETGICTMITELGLDCGDICLKYPIEISKDMNCIELFEICAEKSPELLEKTLEGLKEGTIKPVCQCEDGVCFADKLKKEECKIDWNNSAEEIHNLVRGVYKCPGAFFEFQGKIIKVMRTEPLDENAEGKAGDFVRVSKSGIDVKTGRGLLRLITVKPEGKGEMPARDWANGIKY